MPQLIVWIRRETGYSLGELLFRLGLLKQSRQRNELRATMERRHRPEIELCIAAAPLGPWHKAGVTCSR